MSTPINIQDDQFEEMVEKSDVPVVVDFWAPWCGPCRVVGPVLERLAGEYDGQIRFVKLNVDENPLKAAHYRVQGIPTLLFFRDGELAETVVGAQPEETLRSVIAEALDVPTPS